MAIETRDITIGSTTYRVAQLPTRKGQALLVRIIKLLGPGVGSFVGGIGRSGGELDAAMALGVGDALHDLAARLNELEVAGVLEEFAKNTYVLLSDDVQPLLNTIYDEHFAGRYDELMKWAKFCLEVNYRSFFVVPGDGKPLARLWKIIQQLPSLNLSTGPSTASPAATATPQA